jgi:translation initiation factor 2 alpha subunit (eIF-2alpha)
MTLKSEDLVLCTVEKIERTMVFVKIEDHPEMEGTIVISEISPGRIRNMRDFVVPKKKIVCKVLQTDGKHTQLSLRRVSSKEKKEVMQKFKQEQTARSAFKSILKENFEKTNEKILADFKTLTEYLSNAKEDKTLIEKYVPKENQEQIRKLTDKKKKGIEVKETLHLKCLEKDGIKRIREIFNIKNTELKITYISAGKFQLTLKGTDLKTADKNLQEIIEQIKTNAKQFVCEFDAKEK